jgi:hypothetical protein
MPYEGTGRRSDGSVAVADFVPNDGPGRGALGGIMLTGLVWACSEDRLAGSESDGEP